MISIDGMLLGNSSCCWIHFFLCCLTIVVVDGNIVGHNGIDKSGAAKLNNYCMMLGS